MGDAKPPCEPMGLVLHSTVGLLHGHDGASSTPGADREADWIVLGGHRPGVASEKSAAWIGWIHTNPPRPGPAYIPPSSNADEPPTSPDGAGLEFPWCGRQFADAHGAGTIRFYICLDADVGIAARQRAGMAGSEAFLPPKADRGPRRGKRLFDETVAILTEPKAPVIMFRPAARAGGILAAAA